MDQTRQGIEAQVLARAAKDPQFREQLKADPRGTVARDFGVQVPSTITVKVVEETQSKVYLVLPSATAQRGLEMSHQELESVAGGWSADVDTCNRCEWSGIYQCDAAR